jgi:uncharacterized membrane protein YdjX (TVP38/TMEM64 family)
MFVALLAAVLLIIKYSGVGDYLTLENLKANRDSLLEYVKHNYISSSLAYIFIYIIAIGLSIPGGAVLTLAGGYVFGTFPAVIYVNIGATGGATLAFLITRYLVGDWVQKRYENYLRRFNQEISAHGPNYLLTLRLIPIFPFFLINVCAGLTRIPLKSFIWTTSLGILPGDIVYSFAGSQLGTINSTKDIFSKNIVAAFILLALFSILPVFYNRLKGGRAS